MLSDLEQIHVGALEEIRMNIGNQSYYEQVYDNYLKFLLLLSKYSLAEFQNGLEIIPDSVEIIDAYETTFKFGNFTSHIRLNESMDSDLSCNCLARGDFPMYFCRHMVYAINYTAINELHMNHDFDSDNPIFKCIFDFVNTQSQNFIDSLYFELTNDEKLLFKELLIHISEKKSQTSNDFI